ncbi:MAG: efflux RND transporter periplasmic adaptor subunit [Acidobacteria bacterium]|nr:efflux RND transporter periplasmic adaptor subunit [Acidobacteriota bacterium]
MVRTSFGKALVAFAALAILASCGTSGAPGDTASAAEAPPAPEVSVQTVHGVSLPLYLELVGATRAIDTVEIRARVEGFIEKRLFEAGQSVKAGQLLYKIDPSTYEADVQEARAALSDAQAQLVKAREGVDLLRTEAELVEAEASQLRTQQDVDRLRPLVSEEAVSEQDLDAAVAAQKVAQAQVKAKSAEVQQQRLTQQTDIERGEAAVERTKAALRRAELNLGWTEIRAPVAGRIGESMGQVGSLVTPNAAEPLTRLSPLDPISVSFQVSERDYLRYFGPSGEVKNAEFGLALADGSEYPHTGKFRSAERALDTSTGTLQLTADFPNPKGVLLPGQFARVRLAVGERNDVFLVPQKAVQQLQGVRSVLIADANNTVAARTINVGEQQGESWVVQSGLQDGDRVIVEGLQFIRPGMPVKPVEAKATPAAPAPNPVSE